LTRQGANTTRVMASAHTCGPAPGRMPNGAGKATTIRILATLAAPDGAP
jgi:hypothetical protein